MEYLTHVSSCLLVGITRNTKKRTCVLRCPFPRIFAGKYDVLSGLRNLSKYKYLN